MFALTAISIALLFLLALRSAMCRLACGLVDLVAALAQPIKNSASDASVATAFKTPVIIKKTLASLSLERGISVRILAFLDARSLAHVSSCSSIWNRLADADELWRPHIESFALTPASLASLWCSADVAPTGTLARTVYAALRSSAALPPVCDGDNGMIAFVENSMMPANSVVHRVPPTGPRAIVRHCMPYAVACLVAFWSLFDPIVFAPRDVSHWERVSIRSDIFLRADWLIGLLLTIGILAYLVRTTNDLDNEPPPYLLTCDLLVTSIHGSVSLLLKVGLALHFCVNLSTSKADFLFFKCYARSGDSGRPTQSCTIGLRD
jgi:hypothetical protein